jgi:LEA14-like dessication related protein
VAEQFNAQSGVQVAGVKVENISLTDATMLFDVQVDNPYSVPLPMSNVDYAVASQGQPFASGKADVQGTVPAGGSKTVGVPVKISYVELMKVVKGAAPGRKYLTRPTWGCRRRPRPWGRSACR